MRNHLSYCVSIAKPGQGQTNEDAALTREGLAAVSDGAGGGGIYADLWARYLLDKLPLSPITSFTELDGWVENIWEEFYNDCEKRAKQAGGLVLNKFYDEGSFATLAAAWKDGNLCRWAAYGDSVVFHYNKKTGLLEHSFTEIADFNNPPYLINYNKELNVKGFRCGIFSLDNQSVIFCTTDALAHYIIMMYELSQYEIYKNDIDKAIKANTRNSMLINAEAGNKIDFHNVVCKLINCKTNKYNFTRHIEALLRKRLIALDDYSLAVL